MILKKLKKMYVILFISILFSIPTYSYAYSKEVILGGDSVGILVNSKGIIVVGTYKVNDTYPGRDAKLETGDIITKINNTKVNNIDEMISEIDKNKESNSIKITYLRNDKEYDTKLKLTANSDGVYRTGLYVKDNINGIGTLTFIDPNNNNFGALGHEITESNTDKMLDIKDGKIYKSDITSINKSSRGNPGEKKAKYYPETTLGNIIENTKVGIFGKYNSDLNNKELIQIAENDEIKTGPATIKTVLSSNNIGEYSINILKINNGESDIKNILFEITDEKLIEETGGIVQGMSGSPIIQNGKLIGAVTHVVVDNTKMGYGIFITTMLKEAEN